MDKTGITLTLDLFTLPTAQHRAGLAGFLVLVESMKRRRLGPLPEINEKSDGRYEVLLSRKSLKALFNELYGAGLEEISLNSMRSEKPKRVENKVDGKTGKVKKVYIYDRTVPKASFLAAYNLPKPWLKLWRDAMWSTLRGIPQTRIPYENRCEGKDVMEANKLWGELCLFAQSLLKGKLRSLEIPSPLFLGAQAKSAEQVPFVGRVDECFLLHFWSVVMGVYVPETIDTDGQTGFKGYVLAIPEVTDIKGFVKDFTAGLAQLDPALNRFYPRDAVIAVPQEGALEYLYHVLVLAKVRTMGREIAYSMAGVEVYHLEKVGNSVRTWSSGRVEARRRLLEDYDSVRRRYSEPLFRRQFILNLFHERPWYTGFDRVFSTHPREFFVGRDKDGKDKGAGRFSMDVRKRFQTDLS